MKYFKVRNDIIKTDLEGNPTITDEPKWLRDTIDAWTVGGRFFADEDARYSYIISPNDNLTDLSQNDLEEISEIGIITIINKAFPPVVITREDEPDEIIPTPTLEKVCSIFWGYATNHTGTISADETWTLANNDHHITGGITINANITLTIQAGCNVYFDGNYSIVRTAGSGGTTTLTAIGTPALPITFEANQSRTGTAGTGTITSMIGGANSTALTLQYCKFANATQVLSLVAFTNYALTIDHCFFRDCAAISISSATTIPNLSMSNCIFIKCQWVLSASSSITATGVTFTLTDCTFSLCPFVVYGAVTTGSFTVNYVGCEFIDKTIPLFNTNYISVLTHNFTDCLIDTSYLATTANTALTFIGCLFARANLFPFLTHIAAATLNSSLTNCDLMLSMGFYAINNASTAATTITLTSCYVAGHRGADFYNYYTGSQTPAQTTTSAAGIITFTTPRTTRNFLFTQASITESSLTTTGVTISWTGGFRTRHRVRYGTISGTYTMSVEPAGEWSGWDGNGQLVASPTIVLSNLISGDTYYYVCESWDLVFKNWITSSEGSFTTEGEVAPTFSGITGLENVGFGSLLVSWSVATGTKTNYNIYVKIGSAPNFTEKPIKVDTSYTSFKLTHLSDGTRLTDSDNVYVSVRAENTPTLIDTNTAVLNEYVQGSGSVGVIVGDTVAIGLKG